MAEKPTYEELEQRVKDFEREEEKLKRAEEQNFSTLANNAYDGIVIVTADGSHLYANQRAAEITGYSVPELLEVKMRQLAHPDKIAIFEDRVRRRIRGEEFANQYQTEIFTKEGVPVPVEITGSRTVWQGRPADLIIMRDITERKRAEEALRESEKKLHSFIETTTDWVWEVDINGYFTYASPKAKNLLGYDIEEVVGFNLFNFLAEEDIEPSRTFFKQRCETPEPFSARKITLIRKDGKRVIVELSGTPIYDKDERLLGYFGCDKDITEKVLTEEALSESEKRYRLLAENVRDVIWTLDMNLKPTYISSSVERLRGYSVDEAMNQPLDEVLTPDSLTAAMIIVEKEFEEAAKDNQRDLDKYLVFELEQKCKDGSTVWTETNATFLRDSVGRPTGIIGITRDISERKKSEDALRESEKEYRNLFESFPDPVAILQDGFDIKFNPAFTKLFGYDQQDIENNLELFDFIKDNGDNGDKEIARKRIKGRMAGKKIDPEFHTVDLICKDGRTIPCEARGTLIQYNGKPADLVAFRDVSGRKLAEVALRASEERYRSLVENIDLGITLIDSGHRIIMTNAAHGRLFNKPADEFVGRNCFREFEKRDGVCPHCPGVKAMATGKPQQVETEGVLDSGKRFAAHIYAFPTYGSDGEVTGFIEVVEDITARKDAEELIRKLSHQLITTQEIERQMISRELHDSVAQDLSASRIACEMLLDNELVSDSEVRQKISLISNTLRSTIMAVRDLSCILHPAGLEKQGLTDTLYQLCEEFSEETGVRVDFKSAGIDKLGLNFDTKINLYRLVQECLNNIRKHADANNVKINLVSAFPKIILRIEDDGIGFDTEERLMAANKEKRMGIRSMKERAGLLKGKMSIKSIPGKGTKVVIEVPHKAENIGA